MQDFARSGSAQSLEDIVRQQTGDSDMFQPGRRRIMIQVVLRLAASGKGGSRKPLTFAIEAEEHHCRVGWLCRGIDARSAAHILSPALVLCKQRSAGVPDNSAETAERYIQLAVPNDACFVSEVHEQRQLASAAAEEVCLAGRSMRSKIGWGSVCIQV